MCSKARSRWKERASVHTGTRISSTGGNSPAQAYRIVIGTNNQVGRAHHLRRRNYVNRKLATCFTAVIIHVSVSDGIAAPGCAGRVERVSADAGAAVGSAGRRSCKCYRIIRIADFHVVRTVNFGSRKHRDIECATGIATRYRIGIGVVGLKWNAGRRRPRIEHVAAEESSSGR